MPSLVFARRRWSLGTDDIPLVIAFPAFFHGAWSIFLLVSWCVLDVPKHCHGSAVYTVIIAGLFFTFLFTFLVQSWLVIEGLKGSLFETRRRKRVPYLLWAAVLLLVAEIVFEVYGTVLLYRTQPVCFKTTTQLWSPNGLMQVIVWTTWGILVLMGMLTAATFNLFPDHTSQKSWEHKCRLWLGCCCCIWRNPEGPESDRAPWSRLAELCVSVFGNVDLTPTDVLTCFLLAQTAQRCKREQAVVNLLRGAMVDHSDMIQDQQASNKENGHAIHAATFGDVETGHQHQSGLGSATESSDSVNSNNAMLTLERAASQNHDILEHGRNAGLTICEDEPSLRLLTPSGIASDMRSEWTPRRAARLQAPGLEAVSSKDINTAAHFMKYAFAAYGYMLYIWSEPRYRGCCKLLMGRRCGFILGPLRRYWNSIMAQQWLPDLKVTNYMNREAIQQMTGLPDEDVIFVRYQNEGRFRGCIPYFIAVDRSTKSVVVAIRGTLSLEDCLTDLLCEPAELDAWLKQAHGPGPAGPFSGSSPPVSPVGKDTQRSAHSGMLDAAKAVVEDMKYSGILEALMEGHPEAKKRRNRPPPGKRRGGIVKSLGRSLTSRGSRGSRDPSPAASPDTSHGASPSGPWDARRGESPAESSDSEGDSRDPSPVRVNVGTADGTTPQHEAPEMQQSPSRGRRRRRELPDCRGYNLVVTGHSLGAGTSVLIALYLRNYFPGVRCWAFSPPGGLLDPETADSTVKFTTSVVLGKDWIPRLTLDSFERLRDEMIMAACRCKRSKMHFLLTTIFGKRWREHELFVPEEQVAPEAQDVLREYLAARSASKERQYRHAGARAYRPPGRLMFLRPLKQAAKTLAAHRGYDPVWITAEELLSEGILVSPRMMADHMPDYLTHTLQRLAREGAHDAGEGALPASPTMPPSRAHKKKQDFKRSQTTAT